MKRLLCFLVMIGALALLPAATFAQDTELPANTENPDDAVGAADELDTLTSLEYWHLLAAALPIAIGHVGNAIGVRSATGKARLSLGVYFGYAIVGELLKGSFDDLTFDTPQLVLASTIKAAGIAYAAYKILGNASPTLTGGRPGPTG